MTDTVERLARVLIARGRVPQDGLTVAEQIERVWADEQRRDDAMADARAVLEWCGDNFPYVSAPLRPCTDHPGRENHCLTGWCGTCWLCAERGHDEVHERAYSAGQFRGRRDVTLWFDIDPDARFAKPANQPEPLAMWQRHPIYLDQENGFVGCALDGEHLTGITNQAQADAWRDQHWADVAAKEAGER